MSVISNGFKIGNFTIDKKYMMTTSEIQNLGDAEGYPDVFPIWNTDDGTFYIFYRTEDGTSKISKADSIVNSTEKVVLYPVIDPETNVLSWEAKTFTDEVPEPVELVGKQGEAGKSAYQTWLDLGNSGSEEDFINNITPDMNNLSEVQISNLKTALGINELEDTISKINSTLDDIIGGE